MTQIDKPLYRDVAVGLRNSRDVFTKRCAEMLGRTLDALEQAEARVVEIDNDRLRAIEQRANAGEYHCREHFGQFDADDDVLFLLALIARLRPA